MNPAVPILKAEILEASEERIIGHRYILKYLVSLLPGLKRVNFIRCILDPDLGQNAGIYYRETTDSYCRIEVYNETGESLGRDVSYIWLSWIDQDIRNIVDRYIDECLWKSDIETARMLLEENL